MNQEQMLSDAIVKFQTTLEHLTKTIEVLESDVKDLQKRQNYWTGAIAAIIAAASVFAWFYNIIMTHSAH